MVTPMPVTSSDALVALLDATRRDLAPIVLIVQHDDELMGTDNAVVLMNRVAELAATATRQGAALKAVLGQHTIEKRWQPSPDCDYSYDTAEEAQDDMYDGAEPTFFEICSHCGDIEFRQAGEPGSYLEALWPCATVRVIAEQMEGL